MSQSLSDAGTLLSFFFATSDRNRQNTKVLLALVTILAQSLLTLVSSHLVALLLLSVWHNVCYLIICLFEKSPYFIFEMKLFEGLKAGKS